MRFKILFALLACVCASAQMAVRIDPTPVFTTASNVGVSGPAPVLAVPGATAQLCNAPANGIPCTNFATTYADSSEGANCPVSQQVVLRGTNICTQYADAQGNFGFWVASGLYFYQVTLSNGTVYGPYPVSAGGTGSGGGGNVSTGGTLPSGNVVTGAGTQNVQDSGIAISSLTTGTGSQTLSNKVISGTANTITNVPNAALPGTGTTTINSTPCTLGSSCSISGSGGLAPPVSLKGALSGNSATTTTAVIELDASQYCTVLTACSSNNGIANAATAAAALSPTQVLIRIPSLYGGTDQVQGFNIDDTLSDTCPYSSNVLIRDERKGVATFFCNNAGDAVSNQASTTIDHGVYFAAQGLGATNVLFRQLKFSVLGGGQFGSSGGQSNYNPFGGAMWGKTSGQMIPFNETTACGSPSDCLTRSAAVNSLGGLGYAGFAEGQEYDDIFIGDNWPGKGFVEFTAPTTSVGTGLNTITLGTPTQGLGTLSESRWLVDTSVTPASNTMTVNSCTEFGSVPCLVTLGTPVTAATAIGTVATGVSSLGSQTVTPTLTTGAVSNFSTSALACVSDPGNEPEMIKPSAVGSTTLTMNFRHPHAAGYMISTGGTACGSILEVNADRNTSSTHPEISISGFSVVGTIHRAWMMQDCPTTTTCHVDVMGKGAWREIAFNSNWNASTANGVTIWKAAKVLAISTTGGGDAGLAGGPISLADNSITFASGNTVEVFAGSAWETSGGNHNIVNLEGNFGGAAGCAWCWNSWGIRRSGDVGFGYFNNTPVSYYQNWGGQWLPEQSGLALGGQFLQTETNQYPGQYSDHVVGNCYAAPVGCSAGDHDSWQITDGAGISGAEVADALGWNLSTGEWYLSTHNKLWKLRGLQDGLWIPVITSVVTSDNLAAGSRLHMNSGQTNICWYNSSGSELCAGSGTSGNATQIQSVNVSATAPTDGQTLVYNSGSTEYVPTSLQTVPTCAANATATVSGPCVSGPGAVVNGSYIRTVSGTTDTLRQADWNGIEVYANSGSVAIAVPQAGLAGNFEASYATKLWNNGSGTDTFTPSTSTINGSSTLALTTGQSCVLQSDGTNYICK